MEYIENEVCEDDDYEEDLINGFQRVFPQPARRRDRIRSQSFCLCPEENIEETAQETEVVIQRRPRSNSEPSRGVKSRTHQHRAQVQFPTPFTNKELEELSTIIAGDCKKIQGIDLDFIGVPAKACKAKKLEDLVEVAEDVEEIRDLRFNHFEKALETGRLRLRSDRIWRYKKHRKGYNKEPVDEWLHNSCNNNHELIPNAY